MKQIKHLASLIAAVLCTTATMAQTWNFSSVSSTDQANLAADTQNWTHDTSSTSSGKAQNRYCSVNLYNAEALTANGVELEFTKGLLFTTTQADAVRVDISGSRMSMNKANTVITIKNVTAGSTITVNGKSSSSSTARSISATNVTATSGSWGVNTTDEVTNVGTVTATGDVTITNTGGFYVYSIKVAAPGEVDPDASYNSVSKNVSKNQMLVSLGESATRYYNTDDVAVAIDNAKGTVTVNPVSGSWSDVFTNTVSQLSFAKAQIESGEITNDDTKVNLRKAAGWMNAAYVEWNLFSGATTYNVYVKGGQYADFTKVDYQLVRNYGTYGRADVPGLKAGQYELKVVPVKDGTEQTDAANTATAITVKSHDRSGYAFTNSHVPGAYNLDGTLKQNAVVVYITDSNKDTVKQGVVNAKSGEAELTGFNTIIGGLKKGLETRPFVFRLIGNIGVPSDADKGDILIDLGGKNATSLTIEGIGNDAVANGWGIRVKNAADVEISNLGFLNCKSDEGDNIGLQQDNEYIWVHNCDMFYGNPGGDADQAKGDGALDCKGSNRITFSYNRFWDSGKCNLLGLGEGSNDFYITYHHNWYDHSDSRHPRCRYYNAHVYNNYFDGNAKYGIGASLTSNVFADRNYFRNTNKPMLIKGQGADAADATFKDSSAGMIKAYGNVFAEKSSNFKYTTWAQDNTQFDAYEVSSPTETVPSSVTAVVGGTTYRNFDTNASTFYTYTPDEAEDVPAQVSGQYGAGRLEHGDFQWTFNNATDDADYDVNTALKTAVTNYKTSLVSIFDGSNSGSGSGDTGSGDTGSGDTGSGDTGSGDSGSGSGSETTDGTVISFTGNAISDGQLVSTGEKCSFATNKGSVTYGGVEYTTCIKMESATQLTLTPKSDCTVTLVTDGASKGIKVDGTEQTLDASGLYSFSATSGTAYVITKGDSINLFAVVLK